MRLLTSVEGSVLWLLEDNPFAAENLRREAAVRGVNPERLIFAPRTTPDKHLARQPLADLFLDTLPYNAHTTASDALWVGLAGDHDTGHDVSRTRGGEPAHRDRPAGTDHAFARRLRAARVEAGARCRWRLRAESKARLASRVVSAVRHHALHAPSRGRADVQMWERHQQGLPPQTFSVAPQ